MERGSALIIEDVQNDFCPGWNLAVPDGDQVVPVLNRYSELFRMRGLPVYASRDWHPLNSCHFKAGGGAWPVHCVQGTDGARFHPGLRLPDGILIISKGMDPEKDGYSSFEAFMENGDDFQSSLRQRGVRHLYVGGLATDYCVKNTVLDALRRGFAVTLLIDAVRGVDLTPGDAETAIREMVEAGAQVSCLNRVVEEGVR
ncbi:MAG: nicotinamidase [Geobacteraceae bacterium]|nr:nicotinamidase [Geobacteraceae bacterium]